MNGFIVSNELFIRLSIFVLVFLILCVLEIIYPRRKLAISKPLRWGNNWAISIFNAIFLKLTFPVLGVAAAIYAEANHWGLFNILSLPLWVEVLIFVILFDLIIYLQHRLFHFIPLFWRLHRMHHTDLDYDVTTGTRFHPLSIWLSMLFKLALVIVIGPPAIAVLVSEVLLNVTSMFNHSNIHIPTSIDKLLRLIVVTPDMHRVHHSVRGSEQSQNFGFNFPWWDRLFGTYLEQPEEGHENMVIGLQGYTEQQAIKFHWLLIQPFIKPITK